MFNKKNIFIIIGVFILIVISILIINNYFLVIGYGGECESTAECKEPYLCLKDVDNYPLPSCLPSIYLEEGGIEVGGSGVICDEYNYFCIDGNIKELECGVTTDIGSCDSGDDCKRIDYPSIGTLSSSISINQAKDYLCEGNDDDILNSCIDSDGGKNYDVKGIINMFEDGESFSLQDYCLDDKTVMEHFCINDETGDYVGVSQSGLYCEDGKLIKEEEKIEFCEEFNAKGDRYNIKGYTERCIGDDCIIIYDVCDDNILVEAICGDYKTLKIECLDGCEDGVCIGEEKCIDDSDCNDSKCVDGACILVEECDKDNDCNDDDDCTIDICENGKCKFKSIISCNWKTCKAYQLLNDDNECSFSFKKLITNEGMKAFWNDNTTPIFLGILFIVIIGGLAIYYKKKNDGGFLG